MKDSAKRELRRLFLFGAAVAVLCFVALVYRPADTASFVWDDHALVESNAPYRHVSIGSLFTRPFWPESPLTDARPAYYRPLVLLSFRGDISIGGTSNEFHVTNLLLHLAAGILLMVVAVRAGASYASSILAMLVWSVLPRLTEAVVWVAGRTDVLAAFFGLAALAVWPDLGRTTKRAWPCAALASVLLLASLCSKEVGVAFACAMAMTTLLRGHRARLGWVAVPLVVYGLLRASMGSSVSTRDLGAVRRAGTVFEAVERYAEMILDPFHSRTSIGMLGEVDHVRAGIGVVIAIAAVAAVYFVARKGSFGVRLGLVLFVAAIVPVLHVIPFTLAGSVTADRLLYVPLAGVAIGFACFFKEAPRWAAVAVGLAVALAPATSARAADYQDETEFWLVAAEHAHPSNSMPRMALAGWILRAGESDLSCRLYERSVVVLAASERAGLAAHRRARESLANCWIAAGRYDDGLRLTLELAREYPDSGRIALSLAFAKLHVRDFDGAQASFARALELDPSAAPYAVTPAKLAFIRATAARFDDLTPFERASHLASLGRRADAEAAFLVIATNPESPYCEGATSYLLLDGSIADVDRALAACPANRWDTDALASVKSRRAVLRSLGERRERIEALTR